MSLERDIRRARWVNLIAPGGGMIALGHPWTGVSIGVLFAVSANAAIWTTLLIPDDVPSWTGGLVVALAAATYAGAQLRLPHTVRRRRQVAAQTLRRDALRAARQHLLAGEHEQARQALRPIANAAEQDLLIAYRLAQVLTATQDVGDALGAWERVRRLDRHRLYRAEMKASVSALRATSGTIDRHAGSNGRQA